MKKFTIGQKLNALRAVIVKRTEKTVWVELYTFDWKYVETIKQKIHYSENANCEYFQIGKKSYIYAIF